MKSFIFLLLIHAGSALGQTYCQAPGQAFLETKLKESFATDPAEKELKDIVLNPKNYALREEVKSLDRRSKYADRMEKEFLTSQMSQKFSEMIEISGRGKELANFPVTGATSRVSSDGNSMVMEMNNLSKEELDAIPPHILDKLSNKVKIHYKYPYDKFEYVLTYDGRDLPMQKAFNKIQNELEDSCEKQVLENKITRRKIESSYKIRVSTDSNGSGSSQ